MLINCPRCGFSQPQDQYCAQCGVDMQAFKPKEEPLLTRLLQNTTLQIVILLFAAVFVGQIILRGERPQRWVQKMTHFQGVSKSEKKSSFDQNEVSPNALSGSNEQETTSASEAGELESMRNRSLRIEKNADGSFNATGNNIAGSAVAGQESSTVTFKLSYVEVSHELLNKLIAESSNLGLYQSFADYSAGILYDFKKYGDIYPEKAALKVADIKLAAGTSNSNISGTMTDDGSKVLGLITTLGYKSTESDAIHGNISVARNSRTASDPYPAEFELPKGAAFFMIGIVKRDSFASDRAKFNMPPFQIFKSADFLMGKTELVIIVEPVDK